ncbi:MAG TPA: hypothetical protein VKM54_04000 [Myxococcota bacterium]|nr:hypothetical protein [Myxococcota bacterium]
MSGPGLLRDGVTLVYLKPRFLERVDTLSQALVADLAVAEQIRDELDAVITADELLSHGERRGLYAAGSERDHFRVHWLSDPGYFPEISVRKRFQVIRIAFRDAADAIAKYAHPVTSAWVAGGSDFAAIVDASGPVINLTFYTPKPEFPAATDSGYREDLRVSVVCFDNMRDEIIRELGLRQIAGK